MTETVLDAEKRLSLSLLWTLQCDAYRQFGIGAWSKKGVPSYITSNSFIAKCYAHVVLGYFRDGFDQKVFDFNHPVYLFDLGAGTGRFAYLFLKELFRLIGEGPLTQIKLCYVMTDIAEDNIDFWQNHSYLKPYFEQGLLDCAKFHHSQSQPIHLLGKNKSLNPDNVVNPIVVIANYFFDTIPQDLFRVHNGMLEEGRITLLTRNDALSAPLDPDIINHLKFKYSYHPITAPTNYYEDEDENAILEMYRTEFNDITFLFPTGAFQVLRTFRNLSHSRMLFLAGDQGVYTTEQVKHWGNPIVALHGSFSIAVSYHAISALINRYGKALISTFSDPAFVVMGGILIQDGKGGFRETELAFQEHIDSFEPTEYWRFVSIAEKEWKAPPLSYLLLLIKLGNWDVMSLHAFFALIRASIPNATESEKKRLAETIHRAWENYYPVAPEEESFIKNLGTLLIEMGYFDQAAIYFHRATQIPAITKKIVKS
ncbi:MAG: hypothetical protein H0X29_04865 [Parachlamydiaceae bacterium]|nr:hypothetical protein [Parachlamydiaceae bacterium]